MDYAKPNLSLQRMSIFHDFGHLIFPDCCLMCDGSLVKGEKHLCLHCHYNLPLTNYHCQPDNPLSLRFRGKVPVKYAWAYLKFTKGGRVQNALHQLKYNGKQEMGQLLAQWYGLELKKWNLSQQMDLIIPVPLHASKLKKRGYNQCDPIARGLSQTTGIAWNAGALRRNIANRTQTKLGRMERHANTQRIFEVADHEAVAGKRILLVDDVVTTGSTLEACANALLEAKCADVSIACLAVAQ